MGIPVQNMKPETHHARVVMVHMPVAEAKVAQLGSCMAWPFLHGNSTRPYVRPSLAVETGMRRYRGNTKAAVGR